MIGAKSVIAIIPARAGSKGLPGKNVRLLCGKPLLAWSIQSARKSRYVDEVLVSTDGDDIARVAAEFGAPVPFRRPAELAGDTATTLSAVEHALEFYRDRLQRRFDVLVLLEPTSPLREDSDIDVMLEHLAANWERFDSIVSIGEVREHPSIMKRLRGEELEPYCAELAQTTRRQDNPPAYFPYGVAYVVKVPSLVEEKKFYTRRCGFHVLKRYQGYEIDDLHDFLCVEAVMKHEWRLP
jgi:CMP-N,N'-diacetyllegionaminic acid synthase